MNMNLEMGAIAMFTQWRYVQASKKSAHRTKPCGTPNVCAGVA